MTSPFEATSLYPQAVFIPTSIHRRDMMREQLITLGVPAENVLISDDIFQDENSRLHDFTLTAKDKLFFEVDVARHCNLNCRGCLHYSPLTKPQFLDIEVFHKDIRQIHELFGQNVARVMFIGGEPLLCPNITDFIKLSRKYFHDAVLLIITNGTLVRSMSEDFWRICKEYDVTFYLSPYPLDIDYIELNKFILEKGIKSELAPVFNGRFFLWPFDFSGQQNPRESFINCLSANKCITLRDGRLSTCGTIAYIDTFNEYFGTKMFPTEDDYIDIYKAQSAEEILKFLAKPVPFCRYCDVSRRHDVPWGRSKKEITEWS